MLGVSFLLALLLSSSTAFPSSVRGSLSQLHSIKSKLELEAVFVPPLATSPRDDSDWECLPDIWTGLGTRMPDLLMLVDPAHSDFATFGQAHKLIRRGAHALTLLGLAPGSSVALFSENSHRWFIADQAIMACGASDAVRGSLAPVDELHYIYANSGAAALVVETASLLDHLAPGLAAMLNPPAFVIVLHPPRDADGDPVKGIELGKRAGLHDVRVLGFDEWIGMGVAEAFTSPPILPSSVATIVYTSGTTARPKGVALTHQALLHQVRSCTFSPRGDLDPLPGDTVLSILPIWHIFERTLEYCALSRGAKLIYSSLRSFKGDLSLWKPHYVFAVPRLVQSMQKSIQAGIKKQGLLARRLASLAELVCRAHLLAVGTWRNLILKAKPPTRALRLLAAAAALLLWPLKKIADLLVWRRVLQQTGGRIKCLVSGGSHLPLALDEYFAAAGLRVITGYGLTETGPVISNRRADYPVLGSVGEPLSGVEIKLCDRRTGERVGPGTSGLIFVKTPSIMRGYVNDLAASIGAFDEDGWFSTGDIGEVNPATQQLVITGRAKDTIVLLNGENVPPGPIEDALTQSPLFDQCLLLGQDQAYLSALLVLNPAELLKRGLVDKDLAKALEGALGPQAVTLGPAGDVGLLRSTASALNVRADVRAAVRRELELCLGSPKMSSLGRVQAFCCLLEPFSVRAGGAGGGGNGMLTQTLKMKRDVISKEYAGAISNMYKGRSL